MAAAANNSYCIVGIAYNARIGGEAGASVAPLPFTIPLRDHAHPGHTNGLLGQVVGCCSPRRDSPPWCLGCREPPGCWGRMGDMAYRGLWLHVFGVETFCLGCILAVRVHMD